MSAVFVLDGNPASARLLRMVSTLADGSDVTYVADTSYSDDATLSAQTRVHRILVLLDTLRPAPGDTVMLVGPSMSGMPRSALERACHDAGVHLEHGVDVLRRRLGASTAVAPLVLVGFADDDASAIGNGHARFRFRARSPGEAHPEGRPEVQPDDDLEAWLGRRTHSGAVHVASPTTDVDDLRRVVARVRPGALVIDAAEELAVAAASSATAPGRFRAMVTDPGTDWWAGALDRDVTAFEVLDVDTRRFTLLDAEPSRLALRAMAESGHVDTEARRALTELLRSPRRPEAIAHVAAAIPAADDPPSPARIMKVLEQGMDVAPEIFGTLMAQLHPRAAALNDAATCDAIELWMHATRSRRLAGELRLLATDVRPAFGRHLLKWAARVGRLDHE